MLQLPPDSHCATALQWCADAVGAGGSGGVGAAVGELVPAPLEGADGRGAAALAGARLRAAVSWACRVTTAVRACSSWACIVACSAWKAADSRRASASTWRGGARLAAAPVLGGAPPGPPRGAPARGAPPPPPPPG